MADLIKRLFGRRYERPKGILLFETVQEVILVNRLLSKMGFQVRLVAPPPEFRVGCDLAVEFEPLEQEAIETNLKLEAITPWRVVSTREMLPSVLKQVSFVEIDGYVMCRAGNMKITIDRKERRIVNISGGGCPDIPYVARELHNKHIEEAADPISIGNSLCSYLLQVSFDALKERVKSW